MSVIELISMADIFDISVSHKISFCKENKIYEEI